MFEILAHLIVAFFCGDSEFRVGCLSTVFVLVLAYVMLSIFAAILGAFN